VRPEVSLPRSGEGQPTGGTSRGHAGDDESSGLRGWNKPLKGGTPGAPPAWKWQEGGWSKKPL
jgi:hypothetical protein